jgi:hypothetical protein
MAHRGRALPSWEERMQEEEDGKGEGAHVLLGRPTSDDLTILNGSEGMANPSLLFDFCAMSISSLVHIRVYCVWFLIKIQVY